MANIGEQFYTKINSTIFLTLTTTNNDVNTLIWRINMSSIAAFLYTINYFCDKCLIIYRWEASQQRTAPLFYSSGTDLHRYIWNGRRISRTILLQRRFMSHVFRRGPLSLQFRSTRNKLIGTFIFWRHLIWRC